MTNAEIIVRALDDLLDHEVSLVVFGRAASALGFDHAPDAVGRSMDVDVILRLSEEARLDADDQFWNAQAEVNRVLDMRGLYMTHLFTESQVFLRRDWEFHLVPITSVVLKWLQLFRPATVDRILTKMMRGNDEQDMQDIRFMIEHDRIIRAQLEEAMLQVVIPDSQELRDAFEKARPHVLAMAC